MDTGDYLPEWKLYLLKKLTLDSKKLSARPLTTREFLYVTEREVRDVMEESLHQAMVYIQSIPDRIQAGIKLQDVLDRGSRMTAYKPPQFVSIAILGALIELSSEPGAPIIFRKIEISKQYFSIQERNRIASISMGRGAKNMVNIVPTQPIEVGKLKGLLNLNPSLADYVIFYLEIDQAKINKKIDAYLDDFNEQRLIPPKGERYLTVAEQKTKFLTAIGALEKRFGKDNITTKFTEIIQIVGRENWMEELCRFYETLFLLEQEGAIKIADLRGLEVVFSVIRDASPEQTDVPRRVSSAIKEASDLPLGSQRKLKLLEILKEEWELTPKTGEQRGVITVRWETYTSWISRALLDNHEQLERLLNLFATEGLFQWEILDLYGAGPETTIEIKFPDDFESRYESYTLQIIGSKGNAKTEVTNKVMGAGEKNVSTQDKVQTDVGKNVPHTSEEKGDGYFHFNKHGAKIPIGGISTRPFRLIRRLCDPFGAHQAVNDVFMSIRLPNDANDRELDDWSSQKASKMVRIIKNSCIKEYQKIPQLQGKIKISFNLRETEIWLELMP